MNIYVIKTNSFLKPLEQKSYQTLVGNISLGDHLKKIAGKMKANLLYVDNWQCLKGSKKEEECLVIDDDIFVSQELMEKFLKLARKNKKAVGVVLQNSLYTQRSLAVTQNVVQVNNLIAYNLFYFPKGVSIQEDIDLVIFPLCFNKEYIRMPEHMVVGGKYVVPITNQLIGRIDHWSNLWAMNVLYSLSGIYSLQTSWFQKIRGIIASGSLNQWDILRTINKVDAYSDIHSRAYIEGSKIGKNVQIGAGSVIRSSIIGDNVTIGSNVVIESSVIGNDCTILQGHIMYTVLYPRVFSFTQTVSASLIGADSFLGSGTVLTDFRFDDKTVSVFKNGRLRDTKSTFLGSCLSNRCYLGSGCVVAPGRCLPLDTKRVAPNLIKK